MVTLGYLENLQSESDMILTYGLEMIG